MTLSELREVVSNGRTVLDDLVWRDGWDDWRSVEQVPEIGDLLLRPAERTIVTDATRMVDVPVSGEARSTLAMISMILGIIVLALSCIPPVGFLGVVPLVCGVFSILEINRKQLKGAGLAYSGIVLGILDNVLIIAHI